MENIQSTFKNKKFSGVVVLWTEISVQNAHILKIWFPTGGIIEK